MPAVKSDIKNLPIAAVLAEKPSSQQQQQLPPLYDVVLFNDNVTPMPFVVDVIKTIFHLHHDQAVDRMLTVHYEGEATVGCYPRDVAQMKVAAVKKMAVGQGYPLACVTRPH